MNGFIKVSTSVQKRTVKKNNSNAATKTDQNARKMPGIPDELRKFFPQELVLGPEQLKAIRCKKNRMILLGEPGCGKSFVLLAILFMHTAKCKQNMKSSKFEKVLFSIPKRKTEFWDYVRNFIDKYCDKKFAKLVDLDDLRKESNENVDLILVDESPFDPKKLGCETNFSQNVRIWWANVSAIEHYRIPESKNMDVWTVLYFGNAYRCPLNISLRYTKLRRTNFNPHFSRLKSFHGHPFRNCALHVIDENSIKILKYRESILECGLPEKDLTKESILLVFIDDTDATSDQGFRKLESSCVATFDHCFTYRHDCSHSVVSFPFTGVQYDRVVIVFGYQQSLKNQEEEEILYHAVSRTLRRLVVLCPEPSVTRIARKLSSESLNSNIFMKLKTGGRLLKADFHFMTEELMKEALDIFIISQDFQQLRQLIDYIFESDECVLSKIDTLRILARNLFHSGMQQEFFEMLKNFFHEKLFSFYFPSFYIISANCLTDFSYVSNGRKVLLHLKLIQPNFFRNYDDCGWEISHSQLSALFTASIIWSDLKTFHMLVEKFKNLVQTTQVEIFRSSPNLTVSDTLNHDGKWDKWKCFYECINFIFEQYSTLDNDDRMCFEKDVIRSHVNDQLKQAVTFLHVAFGTPVLTRDFEKYLHRNFRKDIIIMADPLD